MKTLTTQTVINVLEDKLRNTLNTSTSVTDYQLGSFSLAASTSQSWSNINGVILFTDNPITIQIDTNTLVINKTFQFINGSLTDAGVFIPINNFTLTTLDSTPTTNITIVTFT